MRGVQVVLIVGIDPGVTTGLAQWSTRAKVLGMVGSLPIHRAMDYVRSLPPDPDGLLVIFEDARQRSWFGAKGWEALQGAGSIKRDCTIWQDFLTDSSIPFVAQKPGRSPTKRSAEWFAQVTGWDGRTNEHARDAAMLVYGISSERGLLLRNAAIKAVAK